MKKRKDENLQKSAVLSEKGLLTKRYGSIIFLIVYLAYTSIYIARVNLSVAGPGLKDLNILDEAQLGLMGSCFFVVFAVGRMLNGALSDFAAPRVMLTVGLLLTGFSNFMISFFPPFAAMNVFWIVNAYAQSMLWSSVLCVVASLYEGNALKKKTSLMITSVAVGNIMGIVVNGFVVSAVGLKWAFAIPGIIAGVLGVLVFVATRGINGGQKSVKEHTSFLTLLKDKKLLTMNVVAMIHGVMKENIGLWMAVYIADTYFVDLARSSMYILLIPTIGFIGRLAYPALSRLCKGRDSRVSILGFVFCIAASLALCCGKVSAVFAAVLLGGIYMAVSVINTVLLSIYPLSYAKSGNTASVSGVLDFSTYLGAGISSAIYGCVIKYFGYLPMFVSWGAISALSVLILLRMNRVRKEGE